MLIPTNQTPPEWTSTHAKKLADFLSSDAGALMLHWLAFWQPPLLDGSDINKTLVSSGQVKGYQEALQSLMGLTTEKPEETPRTTTYPPLDDESAWSAADNERPL